MSRNPKMVICRNCNTAIAKNAKICPSCGAKNKKPFYKKAWFIILAIIVLIGVIGAIGGGKGEEFDWESDIELCDMLPEPESNVGDIILNDDESLSIEVYETSKSDYKAYLKECEEMGYTVESDKSESNYEAYNSEGYKLTLWYYESEEEMHIDLDAPMELGTLQWPTSELVSLLPVPKSQVGKISNESSDSFYVYVGNTSKDDYNAYVNECSTKGFNVDYDKSENYYNADNAAGYHVSVHYQGNNIMTIEIDKPEETKNESSSTNKNEQSSNSNETTNNESSGLVDGMRPEFKEAMDSYEAFYDEYCDFMKKYKANPSDITLITEYANMVSKLADMDAKFNAWNEGEMNAAELKYYAEVSSRVAQKLLEVSQ